MPGYYWRGDDRCAKLGDSYTRPWSDSNRTKKVQMIKSLKAALAITTLSILLPCAFIRAQDVFHDHRCANTTPPGIMGGDPGRPGGGRQVPHNHLRQFASFQGLNTNEWYKTTFSLPKGTDPQQLTRHN
jgi:hypothetical protein